MILLCQKSKHMDCFFFFLKPESCCLDASNNKHHAYCIRACSRRPRSRKAARRLLTFSSSGWCEQGPPAVWQKPQRRWPMFIPSSRPAPAPGVRQNPRRRMGHVYPLPAQTAHSEASAPASDGSAPGHAASIGSSL